MKKLILLTFCSILLMIHFNTIAQNYHQGDSAAINKTKNVQPNTNTSQQTAASNNGTDSAYIEELRNTYDRVRKRKR